MTAPKQITASYFLLFAIFDAISGISKASRHPRHVDVVFFYIVTF